MTDAGRRSRRAARAVGLLLCVFGAAAQSDEPAGAATPSQVLRCQVVEALPTPPAEAREGGFAFVFESLGGTADDGRACTVYRLRNLPGSPPTPVKWSAGTEVLAEVAGLPRCPEDAACEWFEVARYFDGDFVNGDTLVSYGLNADSFRLESPGLVSFASPDTGAAAASVGTQVVGTVITAEGEEVALDLIVKSRIERGEQGTVLVYEATSAEDSQLDGSRLVLAWEAFDLIPPGALDMGGSAAPFRSPTSGAAVSTERDGDTVSVRIAASAVSYLDRLSLLVLSPDDGELLLRVPMPAFVPGG